MLLGLCLRAHDGANMRAVFSKKKNIDYATFLHRWHNGHTPLSLKIHPLWNYVRNEVKEILTAFNWEIEDMGKIEASGPIEALCQLWCIPGFLHNQWSQAFHFLKK